jgi:MYXO-CTERM domain-containing protein
VRRTALLGAALALVGCGAGDAGDVAARVHGPPLSPLARPDTTLRGTQFSFGKDDVVETHGSQGGRFLVHYTRSGPNAVPATDGDQSGVPDFVEHAAETYEDVATKYQGLGFLTPLGDEAVADDGGDGRFDVYLVDFAGQGDGHYADDACGPKNTEQCAGYMVQENDFKGYGYPSTTIANRILASHEYFHAVQAAYDSKQGAILAEGTAVWATEQFDPTLTDFEGLIPGYLENPDRPLDQPQPGATDAFSYGTAIYWQFLGERYDKPLVRALWESVVNGAGGVASPSWWQTIDPLLQKEAGVSFAESFVEFATYNLYTGKRADPTRSYEHGASYSAVPYEHAKLPYAGESLRVFYASTQYFQALPEGREAITAALVSPPGTGDEAPPDETDGLALLVVADVDGTYGDATRFADPTAGTETIATTGVDDVVVFVVNGRMEGPSRRPTLCIGTVDEVAACKAKFGGGAGAGGGGQGGAGAGGGDAGGAGQGGGATTGSTTTGAAPATASDAPADEGSGCAVASGGPGSSAGLVALGVAAAALGARRRRARRA